MTVVGNAKAWRTRKGRQRRAKAFKVEREAKTFAKKILYERGGYRTVSFESESGHDGTGVVDIVAIRRQKGNRDRLEILLVQVKGGGSRLRKDELARLKDSANMPRLTYTVARKRGRRVTFEPSPFEGVGGDDSKRRTQDSMRIFL